MLLFLRVYVYCIVPAKLLGTSAVHEISYNVSAAKQFKNTIEDCAIEGYLQATNEYV